MRNGFFRGQFLSGILFCSSEVDVNKIGNRLKFRNILLGTLLSFTCLANVSFVKADTYSAPGAINNGAGGQVGNIDRNGNIYNGGGGQIGNIASDGTVYNGGGGQIGKIGGDGTIYNGGGGVVGNIGSDGTVYNGGGGQIGKIGSDGTIYNGGGGVIGHVPAGTVSALTHNNGTSSFAQVEAEIQQRGMPQPVPQGQPSCVIGCNAPLPTPFKQKINIRTLDGSLVGWWDFAQGSVELKANALPCLHLPHSISNKYSGVDKLLSFPDYGSADSIVRLLYSDERTRLESEYPKRAEGLSENGFLAMGYVDQFGNITDLNGKKIAYEEVGDIVFDQYGDTKDAITQMGSGFSYPNVLGIFEPNGDVRDVHNRLVGHLDESQRDDPNSGQPAALKLIQKYEKQHPWHSASRHPVKK